MLCFSVNRPKRCIAGIAEGDIQPSMTYPRGCPNPPSAYAWHARDPAAPVWPVGECRDATGPGRDSGLGKRDHIVQEPHKLRQLAGTKTLEVSTSEIFNKFGQNQPYCREHEHRTLGDQTNLSVAKNTKKYGKRWPQILPSEDR